MPLAPVTKATFWGRGDILCYFDGAWVRILVEDKDGECSDGNGNGNGKFGLLCS